MTEINDLRRTIDRLVADNEVLLAIRDELRAELERLRANQLTDGGEEAIRADERTRVAAWLRGYARTVPAVQVAAGLIERGEMETASAAT